MSYIDDACSSVFAVEHVAPAASRFSRASNCITMEFHLNKFDTAIPVSVFESFTSTMTPSPAAKMGVHVASKVHGVKISERKVRQFAAFALRAEKSITLQWKRDALRVRVKRFPDAWTTV